MATTPATGQSDKQDANVQFRRVLAGDSSFLPALKNVAVDEIAKQELACALAHYDQSGSQ